MAVKKLSKGFLEPAEAKEKIKGLTEIPIRSQIANEVIDLAYGWFTPLQGFMTKADCDAVVKKMELTDGSVWSIPILFDLSEKEIPTMA